MIQIILPDFYLNHDNNQILLSTISNKNVMFYGIEGALPFEILNGKYNNNCRAPFCAYDDIINTLGDYPSIADNMTLFDLGAFKVEESDYPNCFNAVLFDSFLDDNFYYEIADIEYIDYLINKYPKIQIILHENYTAYHTEEEIQNLINKYSNIKGIIITKKNYCKNIQNCIKIGLIQIDCCDDCSRYFICKKAENKNQLKFKRHSIFNECNIRAIKDSNIIFNELEEMKKYTKIISFGPIAIESLNIETYAKITEVLLTIDQEEENND